MKAIFLQTFGCQMNEYDSELVRSILTSAGYAFTDDELEADIVMLNTCSVRENAHRKVYGYIHEIRHHRRRTRGEGRATKDVGRETSNVLRLTSNVNKQPLIGILGCMATGLRKELLENKALALDFVVGPDSYKRLPAIIDNLVVRGQPSAVSRQRCNDHHAVDGCRLTVDESKDITVGYDVTLSESETYSDIYPIRSTSVNPLIQSLEDPGTSLRVNAWVAVMRGCDNFCSFCIVPFTRGRERSRSVANVVGEARRLADEGFPQVTLLGQNVNSYRHDGHGFADLLEAVAKVDGIRRIRFTSPHPKDFPDDLIRVVAENPKICKHIHLPLQAGHDRVLKLMNRQYTSGDFLALVDKIRQAVPSVTLTTDIIAGFPTETDAEFEETVRVMKAVQFDSAFIFKYSVRPNTRAAKELQDDVSAGEKTERTVRLNSLQTEIALQKNRALVGQEQELLMEHGGDGKGGAAYGRNDGNKIVTLPHSDFKPGQFIQARIIRATPHQLKGELKTVKTGICGGFGI